MTTDPPSSRDKPYSQYHSPYLAMGNNPISRIDPDGGWSFNPIVNSNGDLLGASLGADGKADWTGETIVMDDFVAGVTTNEQAKASGTLLSAYEFGINITNNTWARIENNGGDRMTPWLRNRSDYTIWYKPEHDKPDGVFNAGSVGAGKDLYSTIDGIAAPHIKVNSVYKVSDGGRATVTNKIISTYGHFGMGWIAKYIFWHEGWKDINWLYGINGEYDSFENAPAKPNWYDLHKKSVKK